MDGRFNHGGVKSSVISPTESERQPSGIRLLRTACEIAHTFVSSPELPQALKNSCHAILRALSAREVSVLIDPVSGRPVRVKHKSSSTHPPVFDNATRHSFSFGNGEEFRGTLSVLCDSADPHLLESFLPEIANELEYCVALSLANDRRRRRQQQQLSLQPCQSIGILEVDADLAITSWNPGCREIFGWWDHEAIGVPVSSLLSTEASADLSMHVLGALRERRVKRFLMRTSCSRGNEKHVRAEILPLIVDVDGRRCVRVLLQDVTATVHLEKLCDAAIASAQLSATFDSVESAAEVILRELAAPLRAERGEYWAASDSATAWNLDAVWQAKDSADTEARLEKTCAIAATQLRDRVGETRDVVEQFEDDSKADHSATRANRSPRLDGIALPVRSGDRFCGVVTFVGSRLRRADRATMAVLNAAAAQLGVVHRLAEQHDRLLESEQNLLQAQKVGSVGRFVGGIAHDFNNILTVIMGCGNLACDLVDDGSELKQLVDEIVDAGKRASDMTKRLLTMSQKLPRSTQSIDIHRRVDDALPLLNRLIDQRIELKVHSETSDCPVSFDASEFDQILLNLIVNARDAITNSGHITIFVEQARLSVDAAQRFSHGRPGDFIVLSVSDNGGGIDEATRERIFEPYFTTKAPGKGTGMGLATVDNLVRAAGGFLNVDSRVGVGTVVSIFFPRSKEYLRTLHVDGPLEMQGTGREKILLALQDDELRSLTERMLEARGYAVSQASDGEDAVKRVAETPSAIDLIVADANLPEGTIDKIVSSFRNRAKPIPLLFILTEATPSPLINHHLNNGVRSLHIPFTSCELAAVVRDSLDG